MAETKSKPEIKPFKPAVTKEVVIEVSGDAARLVTNTPGVKVVQKGG